MKVLESAHAAGDAIGHFVETGGADALGGLLRSVVPKILKNPLSHVGGVRGKESPAAASTAAGGPGSSPASSGPKPAGPDQIDKDRQQRQADILAAAAARSAAIEAARARALAGAPGAGGAGAGAGRDKVAEAEAERDRLLKQAADARDKVIAKRNEPFADIDFSKAKGTQAGTFFGAAAGRLGGGDTTQKQILGENKKQNDNLTKLQQLVKANPGLGFA